MLYNQFSNKKHNIRGWVNEESFWNDVNDTTGDYWFGSM